MKELKFIHITKTGGTSIENIAKSHNILWGRFHKEYGHWHEIFKQKSIIFKNKYDWFVVVRNPYERIVSEFYCKWGTNIKINKYHISKLEFNYFIQKYIIYRNRVGGYGHYIEQYKYIDDVSNIQILKFENLKEEFNNLMNKYSLNMKLTRHDNKGILKFTIDSLSQESIKLINKVYEKDFKMFGYKRLHL